MTADKIQSSDDKAFLPLIESMVNHDYKLRPPCSEILKYHAFWSPRKVLKFISAVRGFIEHDSAVICNEKCWIDCDKRVAGCYSNQEWFSKLCLRAQEYVVEKQEITGECGVKNLLVTINTMASNYRQLPEPLKQSIGELETKFLSYWLRGFPFIITTLCHGCDRFKTDYRLAKFYQSNQTYIGESNWLLSPSEYISMVSLQINRKKQKC